MIMLETDCNMCRHVEVCKYKNNAKNAMEKLKKTTYGTGYSDDYDWDTIMKSENVVIKFSCPKFI